MQHLSGMDRARSALERGERFPAGLLPELVAESWQRCRDIGLDPNATPREEVLPFAQVRRKREETEGLRRLALAEMQLLYSQIAGSNFMIALGDASGMVLDTISDPVFAESAAGRAIIPGSRWDERNRGTNALGLAAMAGQPVAIYGREHYFASHAHLSCMAAPIVDSHGRVLGLLDASCANEARQQHTHVLVRMAAAQIENGLIFQECPESFILAFHPRGEYLDTLSAGLLAISRDGVVAALNRPGIALLAGLPAAAGSHFQDLFDGDFGRTIDTLLNGGVAAIRDQAGSAVLMVCRQIGQRRPRLLSATTVPVRGVSQAGARTPDFICEDEGLRQAIADLPEAVAMQMPIHLTGETGTGKELMARHIHEVSGREGAFVAVNCGAIAEQLFVAELFGHERGAFTNARHEGSAGLARAAHKGTLFLDEVADIPLAAQTALLRFLDSMEVRAVGGQHSHKIDVQIVSATNRDLRELVAARAFRSDLFYRLAALTIALPPLAVRTDFALVAQHLVQKLAPGTAITDAAIALLRRRAWPGNIRELRSALQKALIRGKGGFIDEAALDDASQERASATACPACRQNPLASRRCSEIRAIFAATEGNISATARQLGLSRTTVYKHVAEERPLREEGRP
ncbi:sigma-54-dependent Fis family transcriptional regulator [Labrys miyagiensis]|uniref:Sigma-54-dependent Fis family transcriptional regulator n=1 Tax=Labrys miyagiensis TaxID=346912 RepID=A0ABQ6CPU4_9HYPH|nr:sigma-54-dependent Fis family transcriptional regulator [Labrys miyagiensis]GLS22179.1 sigma-54-dependent Fis family transcriptional regulator [Labrys miyagiensis]